MVCPNPFDFLNYKTFTWLNQVRCVWREISDLCADFRARSTQIRCNCVPTTVFYVYNTTIVKNCRNHTASRKPLRHYRPVHPTFVSCTLGHSRHIRHLSYRALTVRILKNHKWSGGERIPATCQPCKHSESLPSTD